MYEIERQAIVLTGPWILYDGTCSICRGSALRLGPIARRRGFRLATLQSEIGRAFDPYDADEMKVITREGRVIGGAEGFAYICRHVWWARPVAWLWKLAAARRILRRAYAHVAANRHCTDTACDPRHHKVGA